MTDQEFLQDFEALYDHFFDPIYAFVFRRIADKESVHDIVSETFLKVYRSLDSFQPQHEGSLSSWIYTIAKNETFQYLRKIKDKQNVSLDDVPEPAVQADFVKEVDDHRLHDTVQTLLQQLPDEDRDLIRYKYFDELGNIEIADLLGITDNNATVKLHRALKKFKAVLEENGVQVQSS